ncbi:hypothetical protein BO83DRAFT_378245 [Aspergillus eucalypticola CBS 122712]|uniref:Uncharacterized protein n=1 Tax=Aspergillus eucalypticola (strain CBS 122712 / IBT 29274) TaxID=1448314 RepID=A0A317VJS7_ASPEC|nr:uncharacterized protein BO83DRAFT_378245 [Aspergillus eucalypticola CBS 122712]PWY74175.1 hypothetical protein BO83DRAFT_378245 [Aspergillus eucalypticola CBS 122712]
MCHPRNSSSTVATSYNQKVLIVYGWFSWLVHICALAVPWTLAQCWLCSQFPSTLILDPHLDVYTQNSAKPEERCGDDPTEWIS